MKLRLYAVFVLLSLLFEGCNSIPSSVESFQSDITESTVMVTNLEKASGGSGVILQALEDKSVVLTNSHVCGVVSSGGLITNTHGVTGFVMSFITSETHDLCLILVSSNLGGGVSLATYPPKKYDIATISGHPHLLPNIVTTGHFSDKQVVKVMTGSRTCTEQDKADPDTALFCAVSGKIPLVNTYESIVVSATIQPGSSGSGIFNSRHQLAALVFAGSGELAYAAAVPYEYISYFLNVELKHLKAKIPNLLVGGTKDSSEKEGFAKACKSAETQAQKRICDAIASDKIF